MFFLRAHEEAGESMSSLGHLCGFAHTSVREAIERALNGEELVRRMIKDG